MQKNINSAKRKKSKPINSDFLLITESLAIAAVVFLFVCILSYAANFKKELYYPSALMALTVSCFISGMISGKKKKQQGLLNGILFSLPCCVTVIIISLVVNRLLFDFRILITLVCLITASAFGGVLSVNMKRKIKTKR